MGLNLSNPQIAKELELDPDSAHEMTPLLGNGILAKEPEATLSGEVECDDVYIVAEQQWLCPSVGLPLF